jgi:hypothetical protein
MSIAPAVGSHFDESQIQDRDAVYAGTNNSVMNVATAKPPIWA